MPAAIATIRSWDELPLMVPLGQSARVIGISRSSLYRLLDQDEIRSRKVGGRRFITKTELRRFVEGVS
jgi:excisionase family DNA binding protein